MTIAVAELAGSISADLQRRLPSQRKTQRGKLELLGATMLDACSANLMGLAASLPRPAERADMRYQWIARFIDNALVACDEVMEPFVREVLARAAASGRVALIMDQTKASDRHQILILSVRFDERALRLSWRIETTEGPIGFAVQKQLLETAATRLPPQPHVCLMADRFYGTPDLIAFAIAKGCGQALIERVAHSDDCSHRFRLRIPLIVNSFIRGGHTCASPRHGCCVFRRKPASDSDAIQPPLRGTDGVVVGEQSSTDGTVALE